MKKKEEKQRGRDSEREKGDESRRVEEIWDTGEGRTERGQISRRGV